ncbi:MAG: DUF5131 family protein [Rhizobiales bacterium]|nr:DUF5131 family protein [Hyphomicrobiales bacterium]
MTKIEWTDETWNPVAGCSIVSPGCTNCYAMQMAARLEAMHVESYKGLTRKSGGRTIWTGKINQVKSALAKPLKWKKPRMIFVNSMSDLFHEEVSYWFIIAVWTIMEQTPQHTYQILTKRPRRMKDVLEKFNLPILPNVWLGVSVESDEYRKRIEVLSTIPAAIRFVSFEPLLGNIEYPDLRKIDWAIVGGESGPNARPMQQRWVEIIKLHCEITNTAFFFKQWGGKNKKKAGRLLNGQTYSEMPIIKDLAVVV